MACGFAEVAAGLPLGAATLRKIRRPRSRRRGFGARECIAGVELVPAEPRKMAVLEGELPAEPRKVAAQEGNGRGDG
uniref:Uncharacterized protein n=1 Tax=Oryza meridionalis TaxID=40149 RepID=A0A0E0EQ20_9ORYZ